MSITDRSETPVSFTRNGNEVVIQDGIADGKRRANVTQVDSSILEQKTLEQRDRFTLYKIKVNSCQQSWIIYRRYNDFMLLNKKLRRLFPQLRLNLPGKRYFRDNFASDFIVRRQQGLNDFMRNVLIHRDIALSVPVQRFFRLDNPPQPNESLEASQNYCQSLEVSLVSLRQQLRDQGVELRSLKHHKDESRDLEKHFQQQSASVEETTKSLRDQLQISQENEQRAKEEVERLKEEMKAERASVQAARVIERQRREISINRDLTSLRQSQEAVNQRVDCIVAAVAKLSQEKVQLEFRGKKIEMADDGVSDQVVELRKAITETRTQLDCIYKNSLEMYKEENAELKAELARAKFQAEARASETVNVKKQMEELDLRFRQGFEDQNEYIQKLQRSFDELQQLAISTEEKYFYSLVIGVKLNMTACGVWRAEHMNKLKPHVLFERVREHGISIQHWPSWVSRELATI